MQEHKRRRWTKSSWFYVVILNAAAHLCAFKVILGLDFSFKVLFAGMIIVSAAVLSLNRGVSGQ